MRNVQVIHRYQKQVPKHRKQIMHLGESAVLFHRILQTKTVSRPVLENQQVYIQQKICLRYFELSQTYFRLSPLYFQLSAGSFLSEQKNIFFARRYFSQNLSPPFFRRRRSCQHRLHVKIRLRYSAASGESALFVSVRLQKSIKRNLPENHDTVIFRHI